MRQVYKLSSKGLVNMKENVFLMPKQSKGSLRLSIKKIMFPVQRVAIIEASRAAAIFFFFPLFFFHENIVNFLGEKK